ncbi:hypothetical protein TRVA0_062S00584 [Trichomonascus vanleenenianus]|uniref:DNA-binding transcription factor YAP1 n=1 Tax=Trichomonascus vanleenenianus TaxID=2268995 RepID=UPI003ECA645E
MASTQNFWNEESLFDDPLSDLLSTNGSAYMNGNAQQGIDLPEKRKEDLGQPDNLHTKISKTSESSVPNHTASESPASSSSLSKQAAPKKPGRKIDPNEPANKRKAQNRAAQRAFRERKEKHLRDLEDRVQQLESEAATTSNENQYLKLQVERLQQELTKYRSRSSQSSTTTAPGIGTDSSGQPKQFTFEFPFFPSVKGSDTTTTTNNSTNSSNNNPYPSPQSIHHRSSQTSSSSSVTGLSPADSSKQNLQTTPNDSISPQSYSSSSPFTSISQTTTPQGDCKDCKSGSFEEESFCDQLSLACGQKDDPVPKARLPSNFLAAASTNPLSSSTLTSTKPSIKPGIMRQTLNNNNNSSSNADASVMFPPFDLDFLGSYRDPLFENTEFQLPELQTNEFSLFDPLENPLMGGGSASSSPSSVVDSSMKASKNDEDEVVPAQSKPLMTCSAIWDRVSTHPKFNDLDIDGLCSELRAKAKCSESGVVLSEKDVDNVLSSL